VPSGTPLGNDTAMALGSDSLGVANNGYALLKLIGRCRAHSDMAIQNLSYSV
jgi:hypothetical protein